MLAKLPRLRSRTSKRGETTYFFDHGGKPRHWEPLGKNDAAVLRRYYKLIAATKVDPRSVDKMIGDCIDSLRGKVADGTLKNYHSYRKHLAAVFANDPGEITQADILKYMRLCPRMTFKNEIGLLSMAFAGWMEDGRLTFNPCFGVRIKRKTSKRTRLLLPAEIDAIIAKADERLAVAIELDYATGLRIGDLCALRWADLAGVVTMQKTGLPLEIEASDALTAILARAKALQGRVASLYVLCNARGRRWRPDTLRGYWDAACEAAGILDAHVHDLRAAAGTQVAKLYGQEAARQFLGHKDVRTTLTYLRGLQVNVVRPIQRKA